MIFKKIVKAFIHKLTAFSGLSHKYNHLENRISELESLIVNGFSRLERLDKQRSQIDSGGQKLLVERYRDLASQGKHLGFDEVDFVNYSQTGEDGILLYIFSIIGTTNKYCAEFCAGDGLQCNSANLIINHGWHGLLCDGDSANVEKGVEFYKSHPNTFLIPPHFIQRWINAENINDILLESGFKGEIDLLSIDVDGVDYWLWNALEVSSPRVIVVEVNASWGSELARTVRYQPDFVAQYVWEEDKLAVYGGVSLAALVSLGKEKGYRLIGANRYGFNAFFMRDDVGCDSFPEVSAKSCLQHPVAEWNYERVRPMLDQFDWVEI